MKLSARSLVQIGLVFFLTISLLAGLKLLRQPVRAIGLTSVQIHSTSFSFIKPTHAQTQTIYYVDGVTGNDINDGKTDQTAWKTIQKAANTMTAGDTVNVLAGDYSDQKIRISKSGSAGAPITYQAQGTVKVKGFLVAAPYGSTYNTSNVDYITIRGFEITNTEDPTPGVDDWRMGVGIFIEGSYCVIENNKIHYSTWGGIKLFKQNGNVSVPAGCTVKNNLIYHNGMSGIEVSGRNNLIEGNEIWGSIQHHPGNLAQKNAGWLDADGMRFFGQGHTIRGNYIHDIKFGKVYDENGLVIGENIDPHIDCFQTWSGTSQETASNIIFEQNRCNLLVSQAANENGHGFMLAGGTNNLIIRNNIVTAYGGINTGGQGGAHHLNIYNNIWTNNLSFDQFWPIAIGLQNVPYAVVKNNIFYNQPYHTINAIGDTTGDDIDYNLAYNSNGSTPSCFKFGTYTCKNPPPPHDLWKIDPKFVNPGNGDYRLQSGSPAINAGIAVSTVTNDFDGTPRPQGAGYDIGAYEIARAAGTNYYVDSINGNDTNPGSESQPWQTIQKTVETMVAGDSVYIRGGEYQIPQYGWSFRNSGTVASPITITNYSNEQVILTSSATTGNYNAFNCLPAQGTTPKADYIRILGTDVAAKTLSNGITSTKGLVIQGSTAPNGIHGMLIADCDYWEVAGVDFIDVGYGIFTWKRNDSTGYKATENWHVHHNRVYGFYNESGMQFNGNYNIVENNEIYKVKDRTYTQAGCQQLNFTGHNNTIRDNTLSPNGGQASCNGILLEWDLSDYNIIEKNRIYNTVGVVIAGGDNNIIRNNLIYNTTSPQSNATGAINIYSYDNRTVWPCNDVDAVGRTVPVDDPNNPDYQYFYNPRNCHSFSNQIYNNTIANFDVGIRWNNLVPENTIIRNNALFGWVRGGVCNYNGITGRCDALPSTLVSDHNFEQGNFGFVNAAGFDFHLTAGSPLVNAGYSLENLVTNDFDGTPRPQGAGYDIGAYEFVQSPTQTPTPVPGDLTGDGHVNLADLLQAISSLNVFTYNQVVTNYGK